MYFEGKVKKIRQLRQLAGPEYLGLYFARQLLEECQYDVGKAFELVKQRQMIPLDWQI